MAVVVTAEEFINAAISVHGDKYDYTKVIYHGHNIKVTIICPDHGEFLQTPSSHKAGSGCPICSPRSRHSSEQFINAARLIHSDKYDYSKVDYRNNKTKVTIICPDHGEFLQSPANHKQGNGCPSCGNRIISKKNRKDVTEWVRECDALHDSRYDYALIDYIDNRTPLRIVCPDHGEFLQTPHDHRIGSGCPKCAVNACKTTEAFIRDANELYDDMYDYSKVVYTNAHDGVTIGCKIHGDFATTPNRHLRGHGCSQCNPSGKSKGETDLLDQLDQHGFRAIRNTRKIIPPMELDGYFPDQSVAVEYCGLYWHSEIRGTGKTRHLDKLRQCQSRGIKLITVFEDEWINHPDIVVNRIIYALNGHTGSIYARKCNVKVIDVAAARDFLNLHHLQGYVGCRTRYGMYHMGDLVAVMTFSVPNVAKGQKGPNDDVYEISRFASTGVVGAGGKMLAAFERDHAPKMVYTFADLRWGDGHSYTNMGFTHVYDSKPNFWYFKKRNKRIHRFALRKNSDDDQSLTGWENRKLQGWNRIWDCGNAKYIKQYGDTR